MEVLLIDLQPLKDNYRRLSADLQDSTRLARDSWDLSEPGAMIPSYHDPKPTIGHGGAQLYRYASQQLFDMPIDIPYTFYNK